MKYSQHDFTNNLKNSFSSFDGQSIIDIYSSAISDIIKNNKTDLVFILNAAGTSASESDDYEALSLKTVNAAKASVSFREALSKLIAKVASNSTSSADATTDSSWWSSAWGSTKNAFSLDSLKSVQTGLETGLGIATTGKGILDLFGNKPSGGNSGSNNASSSGSNKTSGGSGNSGSNDSTNALLAAILMKNNASSTPSGSNTAMYVAIGAAILIIGGVVAYFVMRKK